MWEPGGLREAGLPAALSAASPAKALPAESLRPLPTAPPAQGRVSREIVRELEVNSDLSRGDKSELYHILSFTRIYTSNSNAKG